MWSLALSARSLAFIVTLSQSRILLNVHVLGGIIIKIY